MAQVGDIVTIVRAHWGMDVGQRFRIDELGRVPNTVHGFALQPMQDMRDDFDWSIDLANCTIERENQPERLSEVVYLILYKTRGENVIYNATERTERNANQFVRAVEENPRYILLAKKKITVQYDNPE